jgi:ribosomal protein S18 acetylase RimI-like enzyme
LKTAGTVPLWKRERISRKYWQTFYENNSFNTIKQYNPYPKIRLSSYTYIMSTIPIRIRNLCPKDEEQLVEICYLTGTHTTSDKYLFGLRWCLYYLWHQSENSFAAVDENSGQVVGYILGALDTTAMEQHFQQVMVPKIKQHWQNTHHKTVLKWGRYIMLRMTESSAFKSLYPTYPAHLHINLHPEYQRKGIGRQLMQTYEDNLHKHEIPGYHLVVGADNQVGISFYRKLGLNQLKKFPSIGHSLVIAFGKNFRKHPD